MDGNVLVCDEVDPILNKILHDNGLSVSYRPTITHAELAAAIPEFEIVVVRSRTRITADLVSRATRCKILARVGVGLDNIDTAAAREKDIRVINAVEGATNSVAELVIGLMLSLARRIPYVDRGVRNGMWLKKEARGLELRGKYLGIVGMGNIGKRLARLGRAMNMNIIGYDVAPIDPDFAREVGLLRADLDTLLKSSDYVSLHVPLLESTRHLIDAPKLGMMKGSACLINTSRGGVIDEDALYDALSAGKLRGAALDVFESEPATGHRLATLDNAILTPHMGAQTEEAQSLAANVIGEKIVQVIRGVI